jgi:peptidoglycan lytic transglycosylase
LFVPAMPPAPLAPVQLASAGVAAASPTAVQAKAHTHLRVGRERLDVLEGERVTIAGSLGGGAHTAALSRRTIVLQALGARGWRTLKTARTNASGRFRIQFTPRTIGSRAVRISFAGDATDAPALKRLGRLDVYREVGASWYGGGGTTACGSTLTSGTMGVANKTLPCGTLVTLRYGGRTVRVPVIDRGPYVEGREYDLTEATKDALGFEGTGEVWATS